MRGYGLGYGTPLALRSLAGTMERRGGIGPAMVDAAKTMHTLNRQEKIDQQRDFVFNAQKPGLEQEKARAEQQNEKTTVNLFDILPQDISMTTAGHIFGKRSDGKTLAGRLGRSIANSQDAKWDYSVENPTLVGKDGKPIEVPRWMLGEKIAGFMAANTAPDHVLQDRIAEERNRLGTMDPDSQTGAAERQELQGKLEKAEAVLTDPNQLINVHTRYIDQMRQARALAQQYGASEKYLKEFDSAIARSDKKIAEITASAKSARDYKLETEKHALNKKKQEFQESKWEDERRIKEHEAETKRMKAGQLSWKEKNAKYKYNKATFDAQFGEIDEDGDVTYRTLTAAEKDHAVAMAAQLGLRINPIPTDPVVTDNPGWFSGETTTEMWIIPDVGPAADATTALSGPPPSAGNPAQSQVSGPQAAQATPDPANIAWDTPGAAHAADPGQSLLLRNRPASLDLPADSGALAGDMKPDMTPRNPTEALHGRRQPGPSLKTSFQQAVGELNYGGKGQMYGETVLEQALRDNRIGANLHERKLLADQLRQKYQGISDEEIARMIIDARKRV